MVAGPTASGKSDIAIRLARKFNGEIISADSRQVYRGMDIGTGKVRRDKWVVNSEKWRKTDFYSEGIRHHILDVASPTRQYTVAQFKRDGAKAIRDITRRGKLPIICGGTAFWIDTLVYDMTLPEVKPNSDLRARLQKLSTTALFTRLQKLDPLRAKSIDRKNPVRLIRALEIVLTTGRPVPSLQLSVPTYEILYLGLSVPKEILARRIERRLDARLKAGMVTEVRRLRANGVSWKKLESFGLEYRWLSQYLQKKITHQQMRDRLLRDIIKYSKRQMTWLRGNPDVIWITHIAQVIRRTKQFVK